MSTEKPFRVVIAGGGLIGLTAAHIFLKLGIDFIVLEKASTVISPYGTIMGIWPQTFHVFNQLGLKEEYQKVLEHLNQAITLSTRGAQVISIDETFAAWEKNHGYSVAACNRPQLSELLYNALPDSVKPRVLTDKPVASIDVSEDGVSVTCGDGSVYEGSIVVGADGVGSVVRRHIQALRSGVRVEDLTEDQKYPYVATYRMLFGGIPVLPDLPTKNRYDGAQDGLTTQILQGTRRGWYAVYEKKVAPTRGASKYTKADRDAILEKWGDLDMAEGWKLRDVSKWQNDEGGLIDLEEGLIKDPWYYKRLVLVGDAVRKMEPHAGLGYNCGVSDAVTLGNGLWKLLQNNNGEAPTTEALEDVFAKYMAERAQDTALAADMSEKYIRILAWLSPTYRFVAKYVLPYVPLTKWNYESNIMPFIDRAPLLEALGGQKVGELVKRTKSRGQAGGNQQLLAKGTGGILLSTLAVLSFGFYLGRVDRSPSWFFALSRS